MNILTSGLVLTFLVVGPSTGAQAGPWVVDVQLWLPQLRPVLRHYLWERWLVPTKHFRAVRSGPSVEEGRPLLTLALGETAPW
jgi:hypothetical protein